MNARNKCEICGKQLSSRKACQQHKKMVHYSSKKATPQVRSRRGRNRNAGVDIAPSRVPAPKGSTITISGEDRLGAFDIKVGAAVFLNADISPSVSQRIATISRAYQRIKWNSVRIIVTPQASAMTNGGYVTGVIMDPSDRAVTAKDLTSSQGSQTKKWYETASVQMPGKTDLLYTSTGDDPRLSIPATWWLIGEGAPSSALTVVVTILWSVTLSIPTLEDSAQSSFTLRGEILPKVDNFNLVYSPPGSTSTTEDFSGIIPAAIKDIPGYHYFRVPTFIVEYSEGTGDTGTVQAHFIVYRTEDKRMYYSFDGKNPAQTKWQSGVDLQTLVPCGTFCKYVGQENQCMAVRTVPSSLSEDSRDSLKPWQDLSMRLLEMEKFLKRLQVSSEKNSRSSSPIFLEKPTSMGP